MEEQHPADRALQSVRVCHLCMNRDDGQYYCGTIPEWGECSRCGAPSAPHVLLPVANEPHAVGWGQRWVSTSVGLVVAQPFRWDVNGWYARLGVTPAATKREMAAAYALLQDGADPLMTEAYKMLLDREVRWKYDRRLLGQFMNDSLLYDAVLRRSTQMVSDCIARGEEIPEWLQRLIDGPDDEPPVEPVLDAVTPAGHSDGQPLGFYAWQTGNRQEAPLREWQELLIREVAEYKEVFRLAVGYSGLRMVRPWEVKVVDNLMVAFLCDTEVPTTECAQACAAEMVQMRLGRAAHQTQECATR